ncbi:MAG TPA: PASTA domain-containing protein [Pyrinomonadaceae bacterium]|nr:PASTA domain-containing protein [Pyrinomonadaceae bacterium]
MPSNANDESKRKKKLLIYLAVGILIFIFIIIPSATLTGLWISVRQKRAERPPQVKVPNVIGQDYRKGEAMLKEKGLSMEVLAKRSDQNQPVDIILDQVPRGGESVDVGYTVGVMIGGVSAEKGQLPRR